VSTTEHPPLHGVRVLDFTRILSGPYCTLLLAELGAEVIKVERIDGGDETRAWGPPFIDEQESASAYFAALNRGKQSLSIDISHPLGQQTIARLARHSDVVIENFRPGVAERLGLDHPKLTALNPRIVTCSISGFGGEGPYAGLPGTEIVAEAMAGQMSVTGSRDGEPARFGIAMTDITTGLTASTRIVAALMRARESGAGSHIDVSLYATAVGTLGTLVASASLTGEEPTRWGSHHPTIVPYGGFPTSDGDIVTGVIGDKPWPKFCAVIGCTELLDDPALATNPGRVRQRERVESAVAAATSRRTTAELTTALRDSGLLAAPIRTVNEMLADPATAELGLLDPLPELPALLTAKISGDPDGRYGQRVPGLGEHNSTILSEVAQLTSEEIERLIGAGVVGDTA
jgi:formyl-CoA transferase/CoA:oxalate CoA-transferase